MRDTDFTRSELILRYLLIGKVTRDFIIPLNRKAYNDMAGGALLYAASGLALWDRSAGLCGKVGDDFPLENLDCWEKHGFDLSGITRTSEAIESRRFNYYDDPDTMTRENPLSHYSEIGSPLPKALLGYTTRSVQPDSKNRLDIESISPKDIPAEFLDITFAHIGPLDYLSHLTIPTYLRQKRATTITLRPSAGYFNPLFWDEFPKVLKDLTALHCHEKWLVSLFHGKTNDLWEMAGTLADYGIENVIIYRRTRGQYVYQRALGQKWSIPPYPARIVDPTGEVDAFCGGFLAGYRESYDPVEAAVYGNISASIKLEGVGPLYLVDTLPGLAKARFHTVRSGVRLV